ncbi:MAG: HlyD family type I secretion periplasmic adaptor subunit [Candidatus Paracaedibacteraceae bacterium]|nr:HlyD family type I secretion periplasmic adaptor subunit [Candidatus Paracaedibacteraceae bacterium]
MTETTQTATLIPVSLHEVSRQLPTLKQSILLEESRAPRLSQLTILSIIALLSAFVGWAAITPLDQTINSQGKIVAADNFKVIHSLEGGIITEFNVREGDVIKEDQILITLDPQAIKSDFEALKIKEQLLQIKADRLRAFGLNQNFDLTQYPNSMAKIVADHKSIYDMQIRNREEQHLNIMNQIEQRRAQLALTLGQEHDIRHQMEIAEQQRDAAKKLFEKKLGTAANYRHAESNLSKLRKELNALINQSQENRQQITEGEGRIVKLDTDLRQAALKEMEEVTTELATLNEQKKRFQDHLTHLTIKAPITGMIQNLKALKVGEKVQSGQQILQIVPLDNLEAEVKVTPAEMKDIKVGQVVRLQVAGLEAQLNGSVEGTISNIAENPFMGEKNQPYHKVMVKVAKNSLDTDLHYNQLIPGMAVTADIQSGEKTVLQYIAHLIYNP